MENTAKIIAISGKARSGKTTAARRIAGMLTNAAVESFASPLKSIVLTNFAYKLTADDLVNGKDKMLDFGNNSMTVRQLLIEVGRMYRAIDRDFWAAQLMERVNAHSKWKTRYILIDDMRYPNEYDMLKAAGATLVRIERPGVDLIDDPSETSLDGHQFDIQIWNDTTLERYHAALDEVLLRPLSCP